MGIDRQLLIIIEKFLSVTRQERIKGIHDLGKDPDLVARLF